MLHRVPPLLLVRSADCASPRASAATADSTRDAWGSSFIRYAADALRCTTFSPFEENTHAAVTSASSDAANELRHAPAATRLATPASNAGAASLIIASPDSPNDSVP